MAKVFIPQIVTRFDGTERRMVPVFDFSAAAAHGQLTPILDPDDNPLFLSHLTPKIRKALEEFKPGDFLVAVGDPSVIGLCCALLALRHRVFGMLKWDRKLHIYNQVEIRT